MLITHCSQVIPLTPSPQRGSQLGKLNILTGCAVLIHGERIEEISDEASLIRRFPNESRMDARGHAVLPGFVDSHTHLVFAGDRAAEFESRLQGKTYQEIMASGGGINSTVSATRAASREELLAQTGKRAAGMLACGTTTAEAKSGYGLEMEAELKQLEVGLSLDESGPLSIIPTFLAAHAIPPEFAGDADGYTRRIVEEMLPSLLAWWQQHAAVKQLPFVDVFCERGAFNLAQTRDILEKARDLGFPLKTHVDEFENLGGCSLAVELGAASADHLVKTSPEEIRVLAQSETVAVALPCTPFGLADPHFTPAREILAEGGLLAIASDLNPGTAWCESMQFVIALASRYLHLQPAQALAAATINAAAAIRRSDRIGSLHPGKDADIIILSVPDYRQLAYRFGGNLVERVIKRGKLVVDRTMEYPII
jgi:imidazolonepropionase